MNVCFWSIRFKAGRQGNRSGEQGGEAAAGQGCGENEEVKASAAQRGHTDYIVGAIIYQRIISRGVAGTNLCFRRLHICANVCKCVALGFQRRTEASGKLAGRVSSG